MEERLAAAHSRLEIVDAMIRGIEGRQLVLQLVWAAADRDSAVDSVAEALQLGKHAAEAVLDLQLRRMSPGQLEQLRQERRDLDAHIAALSAVR